MQKPKIDDKLTLLTDFGETEAICTEVLDDPATAEGVLLKVMVRGPFQEGQQCRIVDRDGSKIGATVESVFTQTIDSEVTLSTVLPAYSGRVGAPPQSQHLFCCMRACFRHAFLL